LATVRHEAASEAWALTVIVPASAGAPVSAVASAPTHTQPGPVTGREALALVSSSTRPKSTASPSPGKSSGGFTVTGTEASVGARTVPSMVRPPSWMLVVVTVTEVVTVAAPGATSWPSVRDTGPASRAGSVESRSVCSAPCESVRITE